MGLSTTHDCWDGAYGAFHRWRTKLAEVADIPLELMEGYYLPNDMAGRFDLRTIADSIQLTPVGYMKDRLLDLHKLLPIKWSILKPDDALHFLLRHSDCDGDIPVEMCGPLADRLEELLPLLEGDGGGHVGDYQTKTKQFIKGLRLAAANNEAVEFH